MAIYFDDVISGSGFASISPVQVNYVLWRSTALGPDVFIDDLSNADSVIRAGWISLGVSTNYPPTETNIFWSERKWLNFANWFWHPEPTAHGTDVPDFGVWASHIRWALSPGTEGNLLVVGF